MKKTGDERIVIKNDYMWCDLAVFYKNRIKNKRKEEYVAIISNDAEAKDLGYELRKPECTLAGNWYEQIMLPYGLFNIIGCVFSINENKKTMNME